MKHLSLTFILLKGWHFVVPMIRWQLFSVYIMFIQCIYSTPVKALHFCCTLSVFWPVGLTTLFVSFFSLSLFLQPSRWTCRRPWLRPLRPVPKSVWYWATPTAAGCPQPWPSSRVLAATAPPPPLPPLSSLVASPLLASNRAVSGEPKLTWAAWGSWMAAIPWAGLCPKKMN